MALAVTADVVAEKVRFCKLVSNSVLSRESASIVPVTEDPSLETTLIVIAVNNWFKSIVSDARMLKVTVCAAIVWEVIGSDTYCLNKMLRLASLESVKETVVIVEDILVVTHFRRETIEVSFQLAV